MISIARSLRRRRLAILYQTDVARSWGSMVADESKAFGAAAMPRRDTAKRLESNPRDGGCLLLVLPRTPLGLPRLETVVVKTNRAPVIGANQVHPLVDLDREPATITGLSKAGTVPQLDRAFTWEAPTFDLIPNVLSNNIRSHCDSSVTHRRAGSRFMKSKT